MGNKVSQTLGRCLQAISAYTWSAALRKSLFPIWDRQTSRPLSSAALVIHGSGGTVPKTGAAIWYYLANGLLGSIAAATDMSVLVGTVTNAYFNVFCFFADSAGVITTLAGQQATTMLGVQFPVFPTNKALIGFIIINPTGTGNFVGGTTALDDATVVPGTVYVNGVGGFDPWCMTGPL